MPVVLSLRAEHSVAPPTARKTASSPAMAAGDDLLALTVLTLVRPAPTGSSHLTDASCERKTIAGIVLASRRNKAG
jgi:hypothetical protein